MVFYEVLFIGRGGQGGKTAAELVARIALNKGKFVQSFPDYGPERKGAPVRAFTRISDSEIRGCSSEANPDIIVIIDPTLISLNGTLFTITDKQKVLMNTSENPEEIRKQHNITGDLHTVDATTIALETLKSNITNSSMLGALSKISGLYTLEEIKEEFRLEFEKKLSQDALNNNYAAIEKAYGKVR